MSEAERTSGLGVDGFLAVPRLAGLTLSPDGRRLVTAVARPARDGRSFATSLWQVDPQGVQPARRLTRSSAGESNAAFLADGSLLFTSTRRDPDAEPPPADAEEVAALWLLPDGGEARLVATPSGGVDKLAVAFDAPAAAVTSPVRPACTLADDEAAGRRRREAGVSANLYDAYPIRHWDHYLGPRHPRVVRIAVGGGEGAAGLCDLTPGAGTSISEEATPALAPDGGTAVIPWGRTASRYQDLVAVDAQGGRRVLLAEDGCDFEEPAYSPDGRTVVSVRTRRGVPGQGLRVSLVLVDLASGGVREPLAGSDLWPLHPQFTPDSRALLFTADQHGHCPVFRLEVEGPDAGRLTRLTAQGCHSDVCSARDGTAVYALRSSVSEPPGPVRLDAVTADQNATPLPSPAARPALDGRVERVVVTRAGGGAVESWLVLPAGATAEHPAPLCLLIHGGPLASFNAWSWRWNPHLLTARGYAVLLPDPALSTGYGWAHIDRGWDAWQGPPYDDLMAAVDAALERPDVDASRTAALGGSYGGYMANWIAGHSDRFACIVTHAALWDLRSFEGTTDAAYWWHGFFGPPGSADATRRRVEQSPSEGAASIRSPMLVIHGEKDVRVPVSEALRLWYELSWRGVPARFLHFPDEGHWVLRPQNIRIWYQTVLAFLDEHLRGVPFERPDLV